MKKFFSSILALGVIASLAACKAQSPKMQGPVQSFDPVEEDGIEQVELEPQQLDVVFVMDNSSSMGPHQKLIQQEIPKFVHGFKRNALIDSHVMVLPIYDKRGFEEEKRQNLVNPLGILLALKDPAKNGAAVDGPRFVTRDTPRMEDLLGATLNMGASKGQGVGPRYEEMFSPVIALLSQTQDAPENAGAIRANAHLVVIPVTDAEDSTEGWNAQMFVDFLVSKKGGNKAKVAVHPVIIPSTEPVTKDSNHCPRDYMNMAPAKLETAAGLTGGQFVNLCKADFGEKLAEVGILIAESVGTQPIKLKGVPDENRVYRDEKNPDNTSSVAVRFKTRDLDAKKGEYFYDPNTKTVTLSGNIELTPEDGKKPKILYTPINFTNLGTKKLEQK